MALPTTEEFLEMGTAEEVANFIGDVLEASPEVLDKVMAQFVEEDEEDDEDNEDGDSESDTPQ